MYTLAGIANPETGWGRAGETWTFMAALEQLGGELVPPRRRRPRTSSAPAAWAGESLSAIADDFCRRLGARPDHPDADQPVRTMVHTEDGVLPSSAISWSGAASRK